MCAPAFGGAMYFRRKTSAGRAYLQIVESRREGDQVRLQVIATLGRFEDLQASGQLERLLRSGARFAAKAMMLSAAADDAALKIAVHRIGAALLFERLWEETGCRAVIADLAGKRGHKFTLERAVFLTVLHRLFVSGSDRAADRWREDYAIAGVEGLDLHHLYRRWPGWARNYRRRSRTVARCFRRAASRTWWRSGCSRIGATCSRGSTWCSWTPRASTSRAPAARRWASTATARTTALTCGR